MVKALSLGSLLVATTMCCIASCAPQATTTTMTTNGVLRRLRSIASPSPTTLLQQHHYQIAGSASISGGSKLMDEDIANEQNNNSTARSERSALTSGPRKIQFFIKNFHLQILPDGTVNGTLDDNSIYTILQRTATGIGKIKIQGIGTCQYLCMGTCGLLYGSRDFKDDCVFNEMIQEHHYNTYSSTKYSNDSRTLYLAFNRRGISRKVLLHAGKPLGRLSSYTRVLTRTVPLKKLEEMQHPMRHHGHTCPASTEQPNPTPQQNPNPGRKCQGPRKCKRRKGMCCNHDGSDPCHRGQTAGRKKAKLSSSNSSNSHNNSSVSNRDSQNKTSSISRCESVDGSSADCQRVDRKKFASAAKTKYGDKSNSSDVRNRKKKLGKNGGKGSGGGVHKRRLKTTQMPFMTTTLMVEEFTDETDYLDGTTTEWDDSTLSPTIEDIGNPHPD